MAWELLNMQKLTKEILIPGNFTYKHLREIIPTFLSYDVTEGGDFFA